MICNCGSEWDQNGQCKGCSHKKPMYIIFEGADGTGKTTLSQLLAKHLEAHWTFEPYGGQGIAQSIKSKTINLDHICSDLRDFALNKKYNDVVNPIARELIQLANRAISIPYIQKVLESGKTVVKDRSLISGLVFASVASGDDFDMDLWNRLANMVVKPFSQYRKDNDILDIVVFITNAEQKLKEGNNDIYDSAEKSFHQKIENAFLSVQCELIDKLKDNNRRWVVGYENDFTKTPEENLQQLLEQLNPIFNIHNKER